MSSDYRIGIGSDLTYADLAYIDPQPRSESRVTVAERIFAANGMVHLRGPYIQLQYSALEIEEYPLLLAQFSLDDFESFDVTGNFPDHAGIYHLYNGLIYRPVNPVNRYFLTDFSFTVSRLVQIS